MQALNMETIIENMAIENGIDSEAFAAFIDNEDVDLDEAIDLFNERYAGTWESLTEWAENFIEETGLLESVPEHLRFYFDTQAYARDCELGGDVYTLDMSNGDVAVFWNR